MCPSERTLEWAFPNGIRLDVGTCSSTSYDLTNLATQMNDLSTTISLTKGRANLSGMCKSIEALEKNTLLWSSYPNAEYGSIETLTHYCISTLSDISQPFIACCRMRCLDSFTSTDYAF